MEDDILQAKLSMAGRAYIKEQHDWARIAGQLEGIYQVGYEGR
jgi:hypothetical protein